MTAVIFFITFLACTAGKICGMGGGVIIKPIMEAISGYSSGTINILSGFAVIGMSGWSIGKVWIRGESVLKLSTTFPLAAGACIGGIIGRQAFSVVRLAFDSEEFAGILQALLLFAATFLTLLYILNKEKIISMHIEKKAACVVIGLFLGMLGTFLGIGGGPFNMAVLFFFFSMSAKTAAQNSLFIILLSQIAGVLTSIGSIINMKVSVIVVIGMILSGIIGSEVGGKINVRLSNRHVEHLLNAAMIFVMLLCIYNVMSGL